MYAIIVLVSILLLYTVFHELVVGNVSVIKQSSELLFNLIWYDCESCSSRSMCACDVDSIYKHMSEMMSALQYCNDNMYWRYNRIWVLYLFWVNVLWCSSRRNILVLRAKCYVYWTPNVYSTIGDGTEIREDDISDR